MISPDSPEQRRNAGLHRARSLTRWVVATSAGLTAVFSGVAAQAFQGRTTRRASPAPSPARPSASDGSAGAASSAPAAPSDGTAAGGGLQPPTAAPTAAPQPVQPQPQDQSAQPVQPPQGQQAAESPAPVQPRASSAPPVAVSSGS